MEYIQVNTAHSEEHNQKDRDNAAQRHRYSMMNNSSVAARFSY